MGYRLSDDVEDHIDDLLLHSGRGDGIEAARRYSELIQLVMDRIGDEPMIIGSIEIPELKGIRAYPIRLSKLMAARGRRVGSPRHLMIYRVAPDGVTEIFGLVHDQMVLSEAARRMLPPAHPTS